LSKNVIKFIRIYGIINNIYIYIIKNLKALFWDIKE
jgi:hypothetical protein